MVLPYDPRWAEAFEAIRAELCRALDGVAVAIEHVGSTAVPGLWAKPIIDIDAVIQSRERLPEAIASLKRAGYEHEGDLGVEGREAFRYSGKPHLMRHHLYVCARDAAELARHLAFRDYLRAHPEAARAYGEVKRRAALAHPRDIEGYIAAKAPCIRALYAACAPRERA